MTQLDIGFQYPSHTEYVPGVEVAGGIAELREHTCFMPLVPGDLITVDAQGWATGVHQLERVYTYWVGFALPSDIITGQALRQDHPALAQVEALINEFRREGYVTQHTNFDAHVTSSSLKWIEERVLASTFVHHSELIRDPNFSIDLEIAQRHPDMGDGGGPWTLTQPISAGVSTPGKSAGSTPN